MIDITSKFEEVQLVYYNKTKAQDRPKVTNSDQVHSVLRASWDQAQIGLVEECKLMLLDNSLRVMSIASISKGGMSGTVVDLRLIFSIALKRRAHQIILAHNHPSGALHPSNADLKLTKEVMQAGKVMHIPLLDHLILSPDSYCSMMNDGYMDYNL